MKSPLKNGVFARNNSRLLLLILCLFFNHLSIAQNYAIGADLSFMKQAEDNGFVFKENGVAKPCLEIFEDHGYNWVRLRLFHSPTKLPNNLEYTIALAKDAKAKGFKFLLNYHYSDTWADPGKQYLPKAWEGKSHEQLVDSIFQYTKTTMIAFREAGVYPDMVQVGNEVTNGMMWPDGKLPENWDNFADLMQAGINAVNVSCGNNPRPKTMIHITKAGSIEATEYFFDKIKSYNIDFDIIGQSYYPWWHGNLLQLRECLNFTAETYKKDIIVVEAAYNFSPKEYVGKSAPYPETPKGQKAFVEEVNRIILAIPNNRGRGFFWWEPAAPGKGFSTRTYFDKDGNVQPVITVFDKYTRH